MNINKYIIWKLQKVKKMSIYFGRSRKLNDQGIYSLKYIKIYNNFSNRKTQEEINIDKKLFNNNVKDYQNYYYK